MNIFVKTLLKFVLTFSVAYALLLLLSFVMKESYEEAFRSFGNACFGTFRSKGMAWFEQNKNPKDERFTTIVRLVNKEQYTAVMKQGKNTGKAQVRLQGGSVEVSSWYVGMLPMILFLALLVATPMIDWKRKLKALFAGMLCIVALIWFVLYIQLSFEFERIEFLQVLSFSPLMQHVMDALHLLFVEQMGVRFIFPVFIWALVTFKKSDWDEIARLAFPNSSD